MEPQQQGGQGFPMRKPYSTTSSGKRMHSRQRQQPPATRQAPSSAASAGQEQPLRQHRGLAVQGQAAQLHARHHARRVTHWSAQQQQQQQQPFYWCQPAHFAHLAQHAAPDQLIAAYVANMTSAAGSPAGGALNPCLHPHQPFISANGGGSQQVLIDWSGCIGSRQGSVLGSTLFQLLPQPAFPLARPEGPAPDTPQSLMWADSRGASPTARRLPQHASPFAPSPAGSPTAAGHHHHHHPFAGLYRSQSAAAAGAVWVPSAAAAAYMWQPPPPPRSSSSGGGSSSQQARPAHVAGDAPPVRGSSSWGGESCESKAAPMRWQHQQQRQPPHKSCSQAGSSPGAGNRSSAGGSGSHVDFFLPVPAARPVLASDRHSRCGMHACLPPAHFTPPPPPPARGAQPAVAAQQGHQHHHRQAVLRTVSGGAAAASNKSSSTDRPCHPPPPLVQQGQGSSWVQQPGLLARTASSPVCVGRSRLVQMTRDSFTRHGPAPSGSPMSEWAAGSSSSSHSAARQPRLQPPPPPAAAVPATTQQAAPAGSPQLRRIHTSREAAASGSSSTVHQPRLPRSPSAAAACLTPGRQPQALPWLAAAPSAPGSVAGQPARNRQPKWWMPQRAGVGAGVSRASGGGGSPPPRSSSGSGQQHRQLRRGGGSHELHAAAAGRGRVSDGGWCQANSRGAAAAPRSDRAASLAAAVSTLQSAGALLPALHNIGNRLAAKPQILHVAL